MAQAHRQYEELTSNLDSVQVTHVESPVLFYCRLVTDEERVHALQDSIAQYVGEKPTTPSAAALNGPNNKYILVYSTIRDRWCRGRVISFQRNSDARPINAKVCLIDYGSIEIVLWNEKYVCLSTPEIDAFNDGRGFCFPCALGNIKPYDDTKLVGMLQWGSYANFLIEKETKNRHFLLHLMDAGSQSERNFVICDLLPTADPELPLSQTQFASLTSYLVKSNVARYVDRGEFDSLQQIPSDDEKENLFLAPNC